MDVAELVNHLEATHHRYLWDELPRLSALVDKIVAVHGDRHHELHGVADGFAALRADLEPHLLEEEQVVFPAIRQIVASSDAPPVRRSAFGGQIAAMLAEHDRVGALLASLRELTDGFQPPPDACASYRVCYAGRAELEADTHLHVHKENNVLIPAVVQLESPLGEALA